MANPTVEYRVHVLCVQTNRDRSKIHVLFIIYCTKNVIKSLLELSKAYSFEASCFSTFYD